MEEKSKKEKKPKPPEPEFFTPLKAAETLWYFVLRFFANAWFLGSVAILIPVILAMILLHPQSETKKKAKQTEPSSEERRENFTTAKLEQDISAYQTDSTTKAHERASERKVPNKRTLKSDMAVFVFKNEKEPANRYERAPRELQAALGLPSGTKIPALLENRIVSFNVAAPVMAVCPKNVFWNEKVVIPKNSKFLGEANVLKSLDRINVRFDLLIFPDGREIRVRALALSEDGSAGIKGRVEKHRDIKILKAIGETLLGGAALFAGGRQVDPFSLEDQLRLNAAQNLTNQAAQDLRSVRVEESITVEPFIPVQVMLLEQV